MAEGENSIHLPFRAIKLIETPDVEGVYAVAIGVDGELCRLDADWNPLEQHARPFPMSIQHAIVVGDVLIATWIDRELFCKNGMFATQSTIQRRRGTWRFTSRSKS